MSTETARKGAVRRYLADIYQGVASTLIGMGVTGRWAFKKPVTELYPHQTYTPSDRYRGILDCKMEDCTGCMACARACPVDCIHIQTSRRDPEDFSKASDGTPIKLWTTQFDIDMSLCMECGLCTEVCPTLCLTTSKQFELASTTKKSLYLEFAVDAERAAEAARRAAERKAAEAAAKAAEAPAGEKAEPAAAASKPDSPKPAVPNADAAMPDAPKAESPKPAASRAVPAPEAAAQEERAQ